MTYANKSIVNAYRTAEMQVRDANTIRYLAEHGSFIFDKPALLPLAHELALDDVFEAVRDGSITANQGACIIMIKRQAERKALPWFVRAPWWVWDFIRTVLP